MVDDRPSLPERYASAIESSHLEVLPTRCAVDYLVAAGWTRDGLGAMLFRLRTEYDAVRGERTLAILNAHAAAKMAATLRRTAAEVNARARLEVDAGKAGRMEGDAARTNATAEMVDKQAEDAALTARALMMIHLKTLPATRVAVHGFARIHAIRSRFMVPKFPDQERRRIEVVSHVAGRSLDVWIDPACPHCAGRGFNGGYREPVVICDACDGTTNRISGRRGERLGPTHFAHEFGLSLVDELERKADKVARAMRRFMAMQAPTEDSSPARQRLAVQLTMLRSAEAQED